MFKLDNKNISSKEFTSGVVARGNLYDPESGEYFGTRTLLLGNKGRDKGKFIKLYTDDLDWLLSLSKVGLQLFVFIAKRIDVDSVVVNIEVNEFLKEVGYKSRTLYYKAIKELIEKYVIEHKSGFDYYINLNYFYNGNRLKQK